MFQPRSFSTSTSAHQRSAELIALAHLLKIEIEGKVPREGENWKTT
jgi:hypothetical protein